MHGKGGTFCIFLLKIAEKEGKTDLLRAGDAACSDGFTIRADDVACELQGVIL